MTDEEKLARKRETTRLWIERNKDRVREKNRENSKRRYQRDARVREQRKRLSRDWNERNAEFCKVYHKLYYMGIFITKEDFLNGKHKAYLSQECV